jgi:hypothetical protein
VAKYGEDCLGSTQAIHGYISERVQGLLRELLRDVQTQFNANADSLREMELDVTMKVTTGSEAA